jgi:hypothetical protein
MPPLEPLKPLDQSIDLEAKARDVTPEISKEFQLDFSQVAPNTQASAESAKKWMEALERAKELIQKATASSLSKADENKPESSVKLTSTNKNIVEAIELFNNAASTAAQLSLSVSIPQGLNSSMKRLQQGQ